MYLYYLTQFLTLNLTLNYKYEKIAPEICSFEKLEEILKTWKNLGKNEWQPCVMYSHIYYFILNLTDNN